MASRKRDASSSTAHANFPKKLICSQDPPLNPNEAITCSCPGNPIFKPFEIVQDVADHHYVSNRSDCDRNVILEEWILLKRFPESDIYVHGYEGRMDLLRAVFIGPPGTPYQNGLFIFDIQFSEDYPATPPRVNYRSFGHKISPYLSEGGNVTFDILKLDNWGDVRLNMLALLKLMRDSLMRKELGSQTEKEAAFVSSCREMVELLRHPPSNFQHFIHHHFAERGNNILKALKAYGQALTILQEQLQAAFTSTGGSSTGVLTSERSEGEGGDNRTAAIPDKEL